MVDSAGGPLKKWREIMKRLPILMYHKIGYPRPGQRYRNLSVNPKKFARQIRWLKKRHYQTITFSHLHDPTKTLPTKPVIVTFDDGYENTYTDALPIMHPLGFCGCVFVIAGLVGKTNEWSKGRNDVEEPLLQWVQIHELQKAGFEIGCHSMTHRSLNGSHPDTLKREVLESKQLLEKNLGRAIVSFAWPGGVGAEDPEKQKFLSGCGYAFACRSGGGTECLPPTNPLALRRIPLGEKHTLLEFAWKLR